MPPDILSEYSMEIVSMYVQASFYGPTETIQHLDPLSKICSYAPATNEAIFGWMECYKTFKLGEVKAKQMQ